jgi:hypothetical protein
VLRCWFASKSQGALAQIVQEMVIIQRLAARITLVAAAGLQRVLSTALIMWVCIVVRLWLVRVLQWVFN